MFEKSREDRGEMREKHLKHKLGIRAKFFLELGAILAACLISIAFVNSQLLESVYMWNIERNFKNIANETEQAGENYSALLTDFEMTKNVSIDLYDSTGNYVYIGKTSYLSSDKSNVISLKENSDGSYFKVFCPEGSQIQYILYAKDFSNGYYIEISTEINPIQENASLAVTVTTVITVLALCLALAFIYDYSRRFTKPLIQMNEVMKKIASLDFSAKTNIDRNDEIGTLAENINTVSDSLNAALTELREKNAQLLEDIEKERRLERMRQDFVSSASHELKTPIAIIRGYAEGLKMNVGDTSQTDAEYCDIIISEADKMNTLVINMLEQSLYATGTKLPEKYEFDLSAYIENFLKTASPIFKEKHITVETEITPNIVFGDEKQLTTVLSNIILNACSHASGEKIIRISTENTGEFIKICIFNTGSKIEDKDADSIFTSFYRADKSHSRKEGRFGLGLSIVKSIVTNHGCDCGFNNETDGVTFWYTVHKYEEREDS